MINTYDIDGVIYMGKGRVGVFPGMNDHIITGRSFEEAEETHRMLRLRSIHNIVHYNPLKFDEKTRESSGLHKAKVITELHNQFGVIIHFEDDEIQAAIIKEQCPWVNIVLLQHNLVNKENERHI